MPPTLPTLCNYGNTRLEFFVMKNKIRSKLIQDLVHDISISFKLT